MAKLDEELCLPLPEQSAEEQPIDPKKPTAVIFIGKSPGVGMHTLLNIRRMFKKHYENFIFVKIGVIDSKSAVGTDKIKRMRNSSIEDLEYFTDFCKQNGMPSEYYFDLSIDVMSAIEKIIVEINKNYTDTTYFASQLIFPSHKWAQKILHNKTALAIQRQLYSMGFNMMILPVKIHG